MHFTKDLVPKQKPYILSLRLILKSESLILGENGDSSRTSLPPSAHRRLTACKLPKILHCALILTCSPSHKKKILMAPFLTTSSHSARLENTILFPVHLVFSWQQIKLATGRRCCSFTQITLCTFARHRFHVHPCAPGPSAYTHLNEAALRPRQTALSCISSHRFHRNSRTCIAFLKLRHRDLEGGSFFVTPRLLTPCSTWLPKPAGGREW